MSILQNKDPKRVLEFFEEITRIPHGSKNEKALSDFLVEFAKQRNLKVIQDEAFNVIITKDASKGYENAAPIILQGHLDMVCEKVKDSNHDFMRDPLKLKLDGDILSAEGTTLGADNGIAVAFEMAILDDNTLEHPMLECVFTTDEETGLFGAESIDVSNLKSKKLINLDSEDEGIITVSCAGGITCISEIPFSRKNVFGHVFEVKISGLQGGHSGIEIIKERLNASVLMGRVLYQLSKKVKLNIIDINGGNADNVITKECIAHVVVNEDESDLLISELLSIATVIAHECRVTDPKVTIDAVSQGVKSIAALDDICTANIYTLLLAYPQGIYAMSMEIEGLVESSLNLGIVKTEESKLITVASARSSVDSRIHFLADRIEALIASFGGSTKLDGYYPGWEYKADSDLKDLMIKVFKEQYGREPIIEAIHAGLECGLFAEKIEDLDCISIGPDLRNVHTPDEYMDLASVKRVWEFLLEVLRQSK